MNNRQNELLNKVEALVSTYGITSILVALSLTFRKFGPRPAFSDHASWLGMLARATEQRNLEADGHVMDNKVFRSSDLR